MRTQLRLVLLVALAVSVALAEGRAQGNYTITTDAIQVNIAPLEGQVRGVKVNLPSTPDPGKWRIKTVLKKDQWGQYVEHESLSGGYNDKSDKIVTGLDEGSYKFVIATENQIPATGGMTQGVYSGSESNTSSKHYYHL